MPSFSFELEETITFAVDVIAADEQNAREVLQEAIDDGRAEDYIEGERDSTALSIVEKVK
tara:strand:- start:2802 stop:2981 length:180 start_codon:yes stop_codon:yes gene_type:complete